MRFLAGLLLLLSGGALLAAPEQAPLAVAAGLAAAFWPLWRAWNGARGTALRGAVVWSAVACALGVAAELACWSENAGSGRVVAGHITYLSTLATLAALISVLGARKPGAAGWAMLMGLLVLVMMIPWLEAPTLLRHAGGMGRLRLDAPWSIFYALLVVAGVTNYLPTRYGPAVFWLAPGFVLEYLGLERSDWPLERRALVWAVFPWTLMVAVWLAFALRRGRSRRPTRDEGGLERTWLWFRDHWGVVWALRVQEWFNRAADVAGWPVRLNWFGVVRLVTDAAVPDVATTRLKSLMSRFATAERIAREAGGDAP
jgi:hypothetical protein